MVVHTFTPHIAKFARFSLGRFTNRWANEEELNKPAILKENRIPKNVPAQWNVLRWQYQSELLMEIKNKDTEKTRQQQAQYDVALGMADTTAKMKGLMDENHLWMCAV
ncbi:hypothetical protein BCIN_03g00170 [Botrytis cinerea B05.10]|uniref:Uncharacterized protein n=2 Tax=Botryotinia fuckeliana TaxID=40559 RepID=A0A384JAV1_BOTFB|nr:hypothetical protein BCIN_03g00170 [Botrytis cinerea B05.10]ATZ47706.1 hypothetical protein BCIN_03g00170 [Botrytis cinerea B05.10]CDF43960.1 hypothetical protein BofuT4P6000016001 [Botrytis cinerea T4]